MTVLRVFLIACVAHLFAPLLWAAGAASAPATDRKISPQEEEFFETHVRPVLADNCFRCHGAEKQKSGLRLDSRVAVLKGSSDGSVVVPGHPEKSRLIEVVRYQGDVHMPPDGKLAEPQIEALAKWVQLGMPWVERKGRGTGDEGRGVGDKGHAHTQPSSLVPRPSSPSDDDAIERAKNAHWAFRPVRCPDVPIVKGQSWASNPVDRFILAELEKKGLTPSARADRRTLIRRATFDLIGLPPSPADVEAFERDASPNAFAQLVDRLLASPRYGERWGRHWLDVARYADTKGYVFLEERRFPFSYTYRDYVIRAFNEDMPYDQFVVQQLAADQLPPGDDNRQLAAMGFLTLGRRFINNLPDIIDDRIDVVSRGFLGLSVTCARCHDHKYDPIPTADYYSLYGIFASSTEPLEEPLIGKVKQTEAYLAFKKEFDKKKQALDEYTQTKHKELLGDLRSRTPEYLVFVTENKQLPEPDSVVVALGDLRRAVVARWRGYLQKTAQTHDPVFAPWHALAALKAEEFRAKAPSIIANLNASAEPAKRVNTLVKKVLTDHPPVSMKDVARTYGDLLASVHKKWQTLWMASTQPAGKPIQSLADAAEEELRQVLYSADGPTTVSAEDAVIFKVFDHTTRERVHRLRSDIEKFETSSPESPPRAMVLNDLSAPQEGRIFLRGNPVNLGDAVPRQFLKVLSLKNRVPFAKGSGRLELARAIASKDNPLTARVMVNRVWQHHFGAGLVRTPSDFGTRGEPPTHPELLDYLACQFVQDGWSIKKLHRLIMLTSVYQQSSDGDPRNEAVDADNRLLWRMNRHRMEFETLRDSVLAISGKLDLTMGGPSVELTTPPFSPRRAVYGFIERQNLPAVFRMFDFANPDASNPQRHETTVPQQSLFLMNSPFVVEQARQFVQRTDIVQQTAADKRVASMYRLAYGREPSAEERAAAARFISHQDRDTSGPPRRPSAWQYGYGEFDTKSKRVKGFTALPHWTGDMWRGSDKFPDPALGYLSITAGGGHGGGDHQHAAIRRWIAPQGGVVDITGALENPLHPMPCGDGVQGWIVSSRIGELGEWVSHVQKIATTVNHLIVEKGDTVDFVVDLRGTVDCDSFTWAPVISMIDQPAMTAAYQTGATQSRTFGEITAWNAADGFSGPPAQLPPPLNPWEQYAQVLLLTNEFVFVD